MERLKQNYHHYLPILSDSNNDTRANDMLWRIHVAGELGSVAQDSLIANDNFWINFPAFGKKSGWF